MSNLNLVALLEAVKQASRPFKTLETASQSLSGKIESTQQMLNNMNVQATRIDGFRQTNAQLGEMGSQLKLAKQEARVLAIAFKNTENPAEGQAKAMTDARARAAELQQQYNTLRQSMQSQRLELSQSGISTRTLASDHRRLKASIGETTAQLGQQHEALAQVNVRQGKLSKLKQLHQAGQAIAEQVTAAGTRGVNAAKSGLAFIAPVMSFDKQMSDTQAELGLDKSDEKLTSIRNEAREVSVTTGVPATEVAAIQTALARAGFDASAVLSLTREAVDYRQAYDVNSSDAVASIAQAHPELNASGNTSTGVMAINNASQNLSTTLTNSALSENPTTDNERADNQGRSTNEQHIAATRNDNLSGDLQKLTAASEDIRIQIFDDASEPLRQLTQTATSWILTVDRWGQANPGLVTSLATVASGVATAAGIIGSIAQVAVPIISTIDMIITSATLLGGIFSGVCSAIVTAVGLISWPIVAAVAAIAAAALTIIKYWEPVSAFFSGVVEGLQIVFSPLQEIFAPFMPALDAIGQKLGVVWQWFKDLIEPVKSTQETLDSFKEAGEKFGSLLVNALQMPMDLLNKLTGGIDLVLEKLGLVDKKSADVNNKLPFNGDKNAAPLSAGGMVVGGVGGMAAVTMPDGGMIQPLTSYNQAVSRPTTTSYVDQRTNQYNINITGTDPGSQNVGNQIRDHLESFQNDQATFERSMYNYSY